ncbi:MAG: ABC transporter substrate-binding protein [Dorea sp.]|nr:ABC transporter substrate-binding protein [Dorea sp.]
MKRLGRVLICLVMVSAMLLAGCSQSTGKTESQDSSKGEIPKVKLKFATEPYPDHTVPYIGIEQKFFEDVGIELETVDSIDADKVPSVLVAGTYDFASGAPSLFIPSMGQGEFTTFAFSNLFLGYSVMAPEGTKTYSDFVDEGMSGEEAIKAALGQMKGKIFTYPSESAIKPFIDLCFQKAGMTLDDVENEVIDDSNGVALMLSGRADFKVGGVPSAATLASNGFVPILSAKDIVESAEASIDSEEVRSILHNGWTTTKKWADENHDTVLRLASVCFRINQYVNDNPEDAAKIHVNYVNSLAGTEFSEEEVQGLYSTSIPLYTWEMQVPWFEDEEDPLYWEYEIGSTLKMYESEGLFKEEEYKPSDIVSADGVYKELKELKTQAEENLEKLSDVEGEAAELKEKAEYQYSIFNYLDAKNFSEQALEAAK